MSILAAFLAIALNIGWVAIMFLAQWHDREFLPLPERGSIIPGTYQKFLYMQDFYVMMRGDVFALSLIAVAFSQLVANDAVSFTQLCVLAVITMIDAERFAKMCLAKNHKPDQGYPKLGRISLNGLLHLPYHGAFVGISILCLYHAVVTGLLSGLPLRIGIIGAIVYVHAFIMDIKAGNFEPLKKIEK